MYLRQLRVRMSCRDLVSSRKTLAELASEVGFVDHSHFTKEFRRVMGEAPRAAPTAPVTRDVSPRVMLARPAKARCALMRKEYDFSRAKSEGIFLLFVFWQMHKLLAQLEKVIWHGRQ